MADAREIKKHRIKERMERLKRYKRASKNIDMPGEHLSASSYKKKRKVETKFVPAPWSYVLFVALGYAILINLIKLGIYGFSGKPDYTFSNETLEQEYSFLEHAVAEHERSANNIKH